MCVGGWVLDDKMPASSLAELGLREGKARLVAKGELKAEQASLWHFVVQPRPRSHTALCWNYL